jgi:hypothetical protein
MLSKTKVALFAAIILGAASPIFVRRFMTWFLTPLGAPVRLFIPHFTGTFARGLALGHHSGITEASTIGDCIGLRHPHPRHRVRGDGLAAESVGLVI